MSDTCSIRFFITVLHFAPLAYANRPAINRAIDVCEEICATYTRCKIWPRFQASNDVLQCLELCMLYLHLTAMEMHRLLVCFLRPIWNWMEQESVCKCTLCSILCCDACMLISSCRSVERSMVAWGNVPKHRTCGWHKLEMYSNVQRIVGCWHGSATVEADCVLLIRKYWIHARMFLLNVLISTEARQSGKS